MLWLAFVVILAASLFSGRVLLVNGMREILAPLTAWHLFLLVLMYPRLFMLLWMDAKFRWLPGTTPNERAVGCLLLIALAVIATIALHSGSWVSKQRKAVSVKAIRYSAALSLVPWLLGLAGLSAYIVLLGGISTVASSLSESKSVRGGGVILMLSSLTWIAAPMVIAGRARVESLNRTWFAWILFGTTCAVTAVYGRATPIVWGALLFVATSYFGQQKIDFRKALPLLVLAILTFVSFKAFRLAGSWERDVGTLFGYAGLYTEFLISDGGEQAITDMSVRLLLWGDAEFPLGSFWYRWIAWPVELTPRSLFPFDITPVTIGREMYWWATRNVDVDAGAPIFGFVSAYKTAGIGLVIAVYFLFGLVTERLHQRASSGRLASVVGYVMSLCLLLFFSRLGDFSASVVQVIVLGAAPLLFLLFVDSQEYIERAGTRSP